MIESAVMRAEVATRDLLQGQQEFVLGKIVALLREDEIMASRVLLMLESRQLRDSVGAHKSAQH